jgi:parallel beta-helix repeat protein
MRRVRSRYVALLLLILVVAVALATARQITHPAPQRKLSAEHASSPHDPIVINGPEDFTTQGAGSGCGCVREGSGTQADPYVIASWVINASTTNGILIIGTSIHFVISGVTIYGEGSDFSGIFLQDVENGRIERSAITGNNEGIQTLMSSDLAIVNNNVTENEYGVHLEASHRNIVQGNNVSDNSHVAIFVRGSYNRVINNTVARNGFGGINIDGTVAQAIYDVVSGNSVSENEGYGVGLWVAANCVVSDNTVSGNGEYGGIGLAETSYNVTVTRNLVLRNSGNGVSVVERSSANSIILNRVKGNGDGVSHFDLFDDGSGFGNIWANNEFDTRSLRLGAAFVFHSLRLEISRTRPIS